jgi:hypothetical protein
LIPEFDKQFRSVAAPTARFLTGHSSGGWSSLWLQVAYPEQFDGVWSTSPDPVDFRDFQRIDLTKPGENMFVDAKGERVQPDDKGEFPVSSVPYVVFARRNVDVRKAYSELDPGPGLDRL